MKNKELLDAVNQLTCVKAINSVDFVNQVFSLYEQRKVFAISSQPNAEQFSEHTGLDAEAFIDARPGGGWLDLSRVPIEDDSPAQVVFTSGTQGKPKAIILKHRALANVVHRINDKLGIDESIREYIGVPVYHSFGLGRCRAVAAANGRAYIPDNGFDLHEIKSLLSNGEINAISAVPSLWRVLLDNAALISPVADKVKWIEIGSQYMSADEKSRLRDLFNKAKIVQHYGLTEASRTTLLRIDGASEQQLESVGQPDPSTELSLSPAGRLRIRGPHIAAGRIAEGEFQALIDDDGWFETSDLAKIEEGYLYYLGRDDDVINCGGVKFDPANIESEINRGYEPEDHVVLCRIPDKYRGDGILAALLTSTSRDEKAVVDDIDRELVARNINARSAIRLHRVEQIPATATGKIKRAALADTYQPETSDGTENSGTGVRALFSSVFANNQLDDEDTFASLGGDSLNYISTSVGLEKCLGSLPANWDKLPLGKLVALEENASPSSGGIWSLFSTIETSIVVRAYSVCAVVMNHAGLSFLAGGAVLLMLASGLNFKRFQWDGNVGGNFKNLSVSMLINVLIPYWGLLICIPILKGEALNYSHIFLVGNLYIVDIRPPFPAWFIAALIQSLCLVVLPLMIPAVRHWAKHHQFHYGMILLTLGVLSRVIDEHFEWGTTYHMNGGQITWTFWTFALGFCIHAAGDNLRRKALLAMATVVLSYVFFNHDTSRMLTLGIGTLLLIALPSLRIPKLIKPLAAAIGASSLFVYLLHSRAPMEVLPPVFGIDVIRITVGIGLGVVGWWGYNKVVNTLLNHHIVKAWLK